MPLVALILLLTAVNRTERRQLRYAPVPYGYTWRAGWTIALAAGVAFGLGLVLLGLQRFSAPGFSLLSSTFALGFVAALGCGWLAAGLSAKMLRT